MPNGNSPVPLGCFGNGFVVQYEGIPILPPVAQLDRVSDFESEGRRFESYRAGHINLGDEAHRD